MDTAPVPSCSGLFLAVPKFIFSGGTQYRASDLSEHATASLSSKMRGAQATAETTHEPRAAFLAPPVQACHIDTHHRSGDQAFRCRSRKTDCQRHATETDENCMSMVGNTLSPVSSPRCAWLKTLHCWQRETCAWYCGRIVAIQGFPPRPRESCFYRFRVVDGVGPAARTNSSAFKVAQAHGRALSVPWQAQARKDEVGVAVFADGGIRLRD